jgi:ubiquinone/menaquinone biosynthesis C-methylase UbiE
MTLEALPVAIIGAGPVGLAAAAHLLARGETPVILEAGTQVGATVRQWGHVRIFSPWRYNVDAVAADLLETAGWTRGNPDHLPTGQELVDDYLEPLAKLPQIQPQLRLGTRVVSITRRGYDKMSTSGREQAPFVLRLVTPTGEGVLVARAVIDASGTYASPNPLGADGTDAEGEARVRDRVFYGIPDVLGTHRSRYAGRRVAVVGSGHSALNTLLDLVALRADVPATEIVWIVRRPLTARVFGGGAADALPARGALGQQARELLDRGLVALVVGRIAALSHTSVGVAIRDEAGHALAEVDEVVAVTGFRPDLGLLRELRLDLDPIMEAPRALAPLIDPNLHSCGTVPPHGVEELAQAEAGFYIAGMKSYGRAPTFLMLTGYEQVRSIVCALTGDMEGARRVELALPATGVCSAQPSSPVLAGVAPESGGSCCGGPAPAGVEACCARDAEAKAGGHDGCGCGSETVAIAGGAGASGPATRAPAGGAASRRTLLPIAASSGEPRAVSCCGPGDAVVSDSGVRDLVKQKYGQAALRVATGGTSCCGSSTAEGRRDPVTSDLYGTAETADLPLEAVAASLGCGNPTALAELTLGETVLDLGSGGGIDVLLSARRVGPSGKAYGLDMTDEMLALARENQRKAGVTNVEFLKGEIERIPLPGESVDVIISNCVINLSADKDAVLAEAFRVLKPGGRFAVSDVVVRGKVPFEIRRSVELWIGCVAGALEESEYRAKLAKAGFEDIDVEATRIYTAESARDLLAGARLGDEAIAAVEGKFASAFVRGRKPLR